MRRRVAAPPDQIWLNSAVRCTARCPVPLHGLATDCRLARIISLPSRGKAVDEGRCCRLGIFGGRIESVPCAAVAALYCCTSRSLLTLKCQSARAHDSSGSALARWQQQTQDIKEASPQLAISQDCLMSLDWVGCRGRGRGRGRSFYTWLTGRQPAVTLRR